MNTFKDISRNIGQVVLLSQFSLRAKKYLPAEEKWSVAHCKYLDYSLKKFDIGSA